MTYPYTGYAYIKYDPYRAQMKRRTNWWCIATVDREISRYYRYWIKKIYGLETHSPAWDCHISVIRGEKPLDDLMHLWKKYDGLKIEFKYSNIVCPNNNGKFFAIKVESNDLLHIRKELQLPTDYGLHITIGKTYDITSTELRNIYSGVINGYFVNNLGTKFELIYYYIRQNGHLDKLKIIDINSVKYSILNILKYQNNELIPEFTNIYELRFNLEKFNINLDIFDLSIDKLYNLMNIKYRGQNETI